MIRSRLSLLFVLLLAPIVPLPAHAQYMFLDTNGDGLSSAADVIQPSGTTTLDLWLRTNADRSGNTVTCNTGDGELTLNGYEFILHATNGTVTWGAVTNQAPGFGNSGAPATSGTDLHAGAFGTSLAPGSYRLASIVVSPATGTPAIEIAQSTPLSGSFLTAFASQCSGFDVSNTITLGVDWHDVDGVAYGGVANRPPELQPIPDLNVMEAEVLDRPLLATDADGNPVTFEKASGPAFMTVTTTDAGTGLAAGSIRLAPGLTDAGTTPASVRASDGIAAAIADFRVVVEDNNRAPVLAQPENMLAFIGQTTTQDLSASDPDGGLLQFVLVQGPEFVTVSTIDAVNPAQGRVTATPGAYDEGGHTVIVAATDGRIQSERTFSIEVFGAGARGTLLCRPYDMTVVAGSASEQVVMATQVPAATLSFSLVDSPPFASLTPENASATPQTARLLIAPGPSDVGVHSVTVRVDGGILPAFETCRIEVVASATPPVPRPDLFTSTFRSIDVCDIPQGVVITDLNRDGRPDVITPNYGCGISVLLGIGLGQFAERFDVHLDGNPKGVEVADLDGDGDLDAAVSIGFGNAIAVLAGDGTGSFTRAGSLPAGPDAAYVAIADLNGDGIPDLVGADELGNSVSVYLGTGNLSFGGRTTYRAGDAPCYVAVADMSGDGIPDLAAANEHSNALSLHIGRGDGTFEARVLLPTGPGPSAVRAGDFNEDGRVDLAASDFYSQDLTVLLGNGLGGFPTRIDLPTGSAPWSLTTADVNGDGHLDLVSANTGSDDVGIILGNGDGTFRPVLRSTTGSVPRFVAAGDLDVNGKIDLVVAHEVAGTIGILTGNGDGTYGSVESIGNEPVYDVAAGDVTGDGRDDVVSVLFSRSVAQVRPGVEGGGYGAPFELQPGSAPSAAVLADMNRDGVSDLLMPLASSSWALYLGGPGLGSSPPSLVPEGGHASEIEVGDWNRDGLPDVALLSAPDSRLTLLDGNGQGGFTNARATVLAAPWDLSVGDWDHDGWTDFAVGAGAQGTQVFWGSASGITPGPLLPAAEGTSGSTAGDLDGDGRAELVVTEIGSSGNLGIFSKVAYNRLVLYRWTSREAPPTRQVVPGSSGGYGPRIADLTGDGLPDLVLPSGFTRAIAVLPGRPDGGFDRKREYGSGSAPHGLAFTDVDGDGRRDVLVGNPFSTLGVTVLENRGDAVGPLPLAARAFLDAEDRMIRLQSGKPSIRVHVEPIRGAFAPADIDLGSVRMELADGSGDPIAAMASKGGAVEDADRNDVPDLAVLFAKADLRALLASVNGTAQVPVAVSGALATGPRFRAELELRVVARAGGPPSVSVTPNPFNPAGSLRFVLERPGRLRVTVHDVAGRTVARLVDSKTAKAGEYRFPVGRGGAGADLASGVYFYRVETPHGVTTGRFAIVK